MTPAQRAAMIRFHAKVEKAYRAWGEIDNANQARQHREILEADQAVAESLSSDSPAPVTPLEAAPDAQADRP